MFGGLRIPKLENYGLCEIVHDNVKLFYYWLIMFYMTFFRSKLNKLNINYRILNIKVVGNNLIFRVNLEIWLNCVGFGILMMLGVF